MDRAGQVPSPPTREVSTLQEVVQVLKTAKTIAVVGFSAEETKPAYYVPEYMARRGYRIIPVNPSLAERRASYWGVRAVAQLSDIHEPVDVVEVFRRSERVGDHLEDILSMAHRPGWVWLQLGIRNDAVAATLLEQGIGVVQDRCMLADHRQYL